MSRVELLGLQAERVLPIIVLLVAVFLRLHSLDTIPGGLLHDEAYHGIDALRILDGERPIFLTGNNGREALFVYLQAISVAFLGQTSLALRVVSAIIGILTVVAAYILVRRMFSARVALLTCGWVTVSLWHVIESRVGLRTISLPLFLAVGFYCLWRRLEGAKAKKDGSRSAILVRSRRHSSRALSVHLFDSQICPLCHRSAGFVPSVSASQPAPADPAWIDLGPGPDHSRFPAGGTLLPTSSGVLHGKGSAGLDT